MRGKITRSYQQERADGVQMKPRVAHQCLQHQSYLEHVALQESPTWIAWVNHDEHLMNKEDGASSTVSGSQLVGLYVTHPLTHSLTRSLDHSITRSLTRSRTLAQSLTHPLTQSLSRSPVHALSLTHSGGCIRFNVAAVRRHAHSLFHYVHFRSHSSYLCACQVIL